MPIRVVCPKCRRRTRFPDQFAGKQAECRKCGAAVAVPGETPPETPAPTPVEPEVRHAHTGSARWNKWSLARAREHWVGHRIRRESEVAEASERDRKRTGRQKAVPRRPPRRRQVAGSRCRACDDGKMRARTEFRMTGLLVAAGYALLLPAILGLALNFIILATEGFGLAGALSDAMKIPAPTIETVMRIEEITEEHMSLMTPEQQRAVRTARLATAGATLGGVGMGKDAAGLGVIVWLLAGLIGRLLTTKRNLLRCEMCDARVVL